ncbi:hypothetical protein CEXT_758201 [Caerostris extrusa]|uniref:Uncharacterized protein n=1 Tax=Caerostris extrusa TaxID=172846 RepID=A0AAV4Q1A9_CAEEX|nr:hypothetical protein CEXT_758201 [Caerostris extrusa]
MNSFGTERRVVKYAAGDTTWCSYGRKSKRGEVRLLGHEGVVGDGECVQEAENSLLPQDGSFKSVEFIRVRIDSVGEVCINSILGCLSGNVFQVLLKAFRIEVLDSWNEFIRTERRVVKYAAGDTTWCSYGRKSKRAEVRLLGCEGVVGGMCARSRKYFFATETEVSKVLRLGRKAMTIKCLIASHCKLTDTFLPSIRFHQIIMDSYATLLQASISANMCVSTAYGSSTYHMVWPGLSESKFSTAGMNSFGTERRVVKYAAGDKQGAVTVEGAKGRGAASEIRGCREMCVQEAENSLLLQRRKF